MAVGLDINANHVRAVTEGTVTGTARPLHIGRTTQVWEIRIEDERAKTRLHFAPHPCRGSGGGERFGACLQDAKDSCQWLQPVAVGEPGSHEFAASRSHENGSHGTACGADLGLGIVSGATPEPSGIVSG